MRKVWRRLIHEGADGLHLLAAGAWLGGLLGLRFILALSDSDRMPIRARVLLRFSGMGYVAVAVLVASGLINGWFLVGSIGGLVATALRPTPARQALLVRRHAGSRRIQPLLACSSAAKRKRNRHIAGYPNSASPPRSGGRGARPPRHIDRERIGDDRASGQSIVPKLPAVAPWDSDMHTTFSSAGTTKPSDPRVCLVGVRVLSSDVKTPNLVRAGDIFMRHLQCHTTFPHE